MFLPFGIHCIRVIFLLLVSYFFFYLLPYVDTTYTLLDKKWKSALIFLLLPYLDSELDKFFCIYIFCVDSI